ncbi:hypothetical protein GCM10025857_24660 [Alicyclobacillus contaminans]|nr:hypothetical protein GCM10025857_24660 [Alicyclobacillus contaminans]
MGHVGNELLAHAFQFLQCGRHVVHGLHELMKRIWMMLIRWNMRLHPDVKVSLGDLPQRIHHVIPP